MTNGLLVLLCSDGGYVLPSGAVSGSNLVVVEGGPKGIRKMIHLMTNRSSAVYLNYVNDFVMFI
jgi:hypothetical protein